MSARIGADSEPVAAELLDGQPPPVSGAPQSLQRFQFTLARLLRCISFASLTFALLMAAFSPLNTNGVVASLFFLGVPASLGAAVGSLAGRSMRGALIGFGLWAASPAIFFVFFWIYGCCLVENGFLRWALIGANVTALAAALLTIRRPRWAGWLLIASGIVIGVCAAFASAMPRLVSSSFGRSYGDTRGSGLYVLMLIGMAFLVSLAMIIGGFVVLLMTRHSHRSPPNAPSRQQHAQ